MGKVRVEYLVRQDGDVRRGLRSTIPYMRGRRLIHGVW